MKKTIDIHLTRNNTGDQGTEGIFSVPDFSFSCCSLELPWRNNQTDISCIPTGIYSLEWRTTKSRTSFNILNVPGRSDVQIHSGNFAGDVSLGFKSHVEGCVLLGQRFGFLEGQRAVMVSSKMVKRFNRLLQDAEKIRIIIREVWDEKQIKPVGGQRGRM